jgi:membrane-associated phospholipid phosphatase
MLRVLYAATVLTISVALIAGDFHFLSDVIAGAFVGISLSVLVVNLWEDLFPVPAARASQDIPARSSALAGGTRAYMRSSD